MSQDIDFERRMRDRGLIPRASVGSTRLKRIPDSDNDPGNDRFSAFVIDADAGVGREAELTRGEASGLQALRPDARILGDDELLVGPEEEEFLAQIGRPKPPGPSARAVALKRLAEGASGPMQVDDTTPRGGLKGRTPEMLADLEAQQTNVQQGLRLKGQPTPATLTRKSSGTPPISVGKPGVAGAPRMPEPLAASAPARQEPTSAVAAQPPPVAAGDEEFASAQERARGNRLGASIGRAGETIAAGISGRKADGSFYDGLEQDADLPVTELLARREADKRKALQDPTSEPSRRLQQAVAKALPGVYTPEELAQLTAEDERMVTQYGAMRQRLDERKLDISRQEQQRKEALAREDTVRADERAWQARQAAAGRAFTAGENAKNRAADLAEAQARGAAAGQAAQKLPAGEASALGEAEAAVQSLKDLGAAYDADIDSGFGSFATGLTQYLPGTDATLYEDKMRATAQSVGTFLEGGKLAAGDEVKYLRMLPTPGDGAERKKGKLDNLNRLIATKRQEKINALKAAGFNLGNLGAGEAPAAQPQAASGLPREVKNGKTYEYENGQWHEVT